MKKKFFIITIFSILFFVFTSCENPIGNNSPQEIKTTINFTNNVPLNLNYVSLGNVICVNPIYDGLTSSVYNITPGQYQLEAEFEGYNRTTFSHYFTIEKGYNYNLKLDGYEYPYLNSNGTITYKLSLYSSLTTY
jgi:hypothetical protein